MTQEAPPSSPGTPIPERYRNGTSPRIDQAIWLARAVVTFGLGTLSLLISQQVGHLQPYSRLVFGTEAAITLCVVLAVGWIALDQRRRRKAVARSGEAIPPAELARLRRQQFNFQLTLAAIVLIGIIQGTTAAENWTQQQTINRTILLEKQALSLQGTTLAAIDRNIAQSLANEALLGRAATDAAHTQVLARADTATVLAAVDGAVTPSSAYRRSVDAALCAELRDVRAIAVALRIPLEPLLDPPNSVAHVTLGGCRVAVIAR